MTIIRLKPKQGATEDVMDQKPMKEKKKKDKKKKEPKQRKRDKEEKDISSAQQLSADEDAVEQEMDKHDSEIQEKAKRSKKHSRSHHEDENDDGDDERSSPPTKKQKISSRTTHGCKEARAARRLQRQKLMEQVPKTDEHGIAYTKLQLRRMCKRVAKGLHPIESEAEKQERLHSEAELRREEEMELAGMLYDDNDKEDSEEEQEESQNDHEDGSEADSDDEGDDAENGDEKVPKKPVVQGKAETTAATAAAAKQPKIKSHRNKPVPHDYICSACQNRHKPAHWIYDCPDKVTVRGTNQVSKKQFKGIKNPDTRKVFVSGLPFDVKIKDVEKMFTASCGPVLHCKLIKFQDTGRCKGQAYVTFTTEHGAKKALEMSGSVIQNNIDEKEDVKKGGLSSSSSSSSSPKKRKELKLKVTKALNRTVTKRNT